MNGQRAPNGRGRIAEFDLLRGAAIVGVVFLHAYFTPWPEVSKGGLVAIHASHLVANGAVPLFLFISAYLQGAAQKEGMLGYLARRSRRIWIPAAIWMLATFAYRTVNDGASLGLIREFALFNISGQFYFVWLLLVFSAVLTQGWRVSERWLPPTVAGAFAINLVMIGWYAEQPSISGYEAVFAYRNPLVWVFFPAFGYALGRRGLSAMPTRVVHHAALVMAMAATVYLYRGIARDTWPVSYFGVSVFLFSAAGTVVYPSLARLALRSVAIARPLDGLSHYALAIYLIHMPFVMGFGTKEILGNGAAWSNYWVLLMANFAVGLFVSLAVIREMEKLSPGLSGWLFGTTRVRREVEAARPNEAPSADVPGVDERPVKEPLAS
ncbi:MAG: acyltransferase [Dehalococcoidia bacterium]